MYKAKVLQPPRPEDAAEATKIVAAAKRPTILCGLGAQGKAEPEVRKLAEYLGAPVATTLYSAGFCSQYPLYLGISGGLGSDFTVDTLAESDVMIVVGASLNEWTTHFGKIRASTIGKSGQCVRNIPMMNHRLRSWAARVLWLGSLLNTGLAVTFCRHSFSRRWANRSRAALR
jgi:thiamine pyrophosphate-dependent acetolactate synthase large subunit-like protein